MKGRRRIRTKRWVDCIAERIRDFTLTRSAAQIIGDAIVEFAFQAADHGDVLHVAEEARGKAARELLKRAVDRAIFLAQILDRSVTRITIEEAAVCGAVGIVPEGVDFH